MQCMQPEHAAAFIAQATGLAQHGFDLAVEALQRAAAAAVLPPSEDAFSLADECPGEFLHKRVGAKSLPQSLLRQHCSSATIVVGFKPMGTVHNCRVRLPMRSTWREAQSGHPNRSSCTAT
jgi:hypothetical protein